MGTAIAPQKEGPGFIARLSAFAQGVNVELKKVTWPDVPQVRTATVAIIIFVLLMGLVIALLDLVLRGVLVQAIPSLFA